jgi:LysM repeat protein
MPRVHRVDHGDTLFGIAQKFYGDGMKFPIIAQANGIRDPDKIFPGQVLQIPDLAPPPPPQPAPQPPPPPQPEPPPEPISFRLLRPADLLKPELQLLTPGTSGDLRVQVEEYELLPADPPPGEQMPSTAERLVYADHFPL